MQNLASTVGGLLKNLTAKIQNDPEENNGRDAMTTVNEIDTAIDSARQSGINIPQKVLSAQATARDLAEGALKSPRGLPKLVDVKVAKRLAEQLIGNAIEKDKAAAVEEAIEREIAAAEAEQEAVAEKAAAEKAATEKAAAAKAAAEKAAAKVAA